MNFDAQNAYKAALYARAAARDALTAATAALDAACTAADIAHGQWGEVRDLDIAPRAARDYSAACTAADAAADAEAEAAATFAAACAAARDAYAACPAWQRNFY